MSKYSYELKLEIVMYVLELKHSQGEAVRKYGITKMQIQNWIKLYQKHGSEGLLLRKGTYSGDFKISVIEYMHKTKKSIFDTSTHFGIPSASTVLKWERIYYEKGPQALYEDKRSRNKTMNTDKPQKPKLTKQIEEDLITEVQRLRMEVAYLKKLNALVSEREKSAKKTK